MTLIRFGNKDSHALPPSLPHGQIVKALSVHFVTPTALSILDITSMGDSAKRDDPSKIGQFDSGLKYAIALLLRNKVRIEIVVKVKENGDIRMIRHTFDTSTQRDSITSKEKRIIRVSSHVQLEDRTGHIQKRAGELINTGFALNLGYNWELWMAYRELWSNMRDEEGQLYENTHPEIESGTVISLTFQEQSPFHMVFKESIKYINVTGWSEINKDFGVMDSPDGKLRIFKQGILVHSDDTPSKFMFNIKFGEIDERRLLRNVSEVESQLASRILCTNNTGFLCKIITEKPLSDGEFLSNTSAYGLASDLAHEIAFTVWHQHGEVHSYPWLMKLIRSRPDCKIGNKIIRTLEDSIWASSKEVTVKTIPVKVKDVPGDDKSLRARIRKLYKFDLNVEVREAKLFGSKVVADKFNKCLIVDESFSTETDMPELIVQYLDLTIGGNIVKALSVYICDLIKV